MKSLPVLLATLLGIGMTACGGSDKSANPTSRASSIAARTDTAPTADLTGTTAAGNRSKDASDGDSDPAGNDDGPILGFGHPATEAQTGTITALVKRYYAAAAANDGSEACSDIYLILRESIPEDYGRVPGPPALRGKTCAVVMSKLFEQRHHLLLVDNTHLQVAGVRLEGKEGYALLRFGSAQRAIRLHSELGTWRIDSLVDGPLP